MPDPQRLLRRAPGYPSRLGPKALETRGALLDALEAHLACTAWREVRVPKVAAEAGRSPATFYQFFPDVYAAFDAVLARVAQEGRRPGAHLRLIACLVDWERRELRS